MKSKMFFALAASALMTIGASAQGVRSQERRSEYRNEYRNEYREPVRREFVRHERFVERRGFERAYEPAYVERGYRREWCERPVVRRRW